MTDAPSTTLAARAVGATKIYGSGDTEVRALAGVDVTDGQLSTQEERMPPRRDFQRVAAARVALAAEPQLERQRRRRRVERRVRHRDARVGRHVHGLGDVAPAAREAAAVRVEVARRAHAVVEADGDAALAAHDSIDRRAPGRGPARVAAVEDELCRRCGWE